MFQVTVNVVTQEEEPCLGLAWSNLISSRFNIVRRNDNRVREFNVVFASDLPDGKAKFIISEAGLKGVL